MMINSGQGNQFTPEESVKTTRSMEGVQISLDAKGRGIDNVGVEFFLKRLNMLIRSRIAERCIKALGSW